MKEEVNYIYIEMLDLNRLFFFKKINIIDI